MKKKFVIISVFALSLLVMIGSCEQSVGKLPNKIDKNLGNNKLFADAGESENCIVCNKIEDEQRGGNGENEDATSITSMQCCVTPPDDLEENCGTKEEFCGGMDEIS